MRAQARADVVAQAELLAHVQKELGRDAAAVEGVKDEQRRDVRLGHARAETVAHGELPLRDRERLGHIARLGFERVHADVRADVLVDLAARHRREHVREDARDAPALERAAVEDLHGARREHVVVAHRELAVVDALGVRLFAETGHGVVLAAAHVGVQPLDGVGALVVHAGADALEQLLTLAVHDIRPQQAAARVRVQQEVCHVGREPGEDLLAHRAVVGKLGLEAHGLDLAELAHARRDARAVEAFELGCDRLQIGQARAAAPQHIRQHGRAGRRRAPQLRQQVHAQPRGLELVRAQGGQPHAGENFRADAFHKIRSFRLWCVHIF